jgi:crossover junction endodeoxyribonuclease RuvC
MIVLGLDPGTATTGYGVIKTGEKGFDLVKWGLIETDKKMEMGKRLETIYNETLKLIKQYSPDIFVIERIFFATNAKTAISVGQAQGVMLLAASHYKVRVAEYAPGTIKKVITGSGRANKRDVQRAIRKILGNRVKSQKRKRTHFDNAADALAIALTHVAISLNETAKLSNG